MDSFIITIHPTVKIVIYSLSVEKFIGRPRAQFLPLLSLILIPATSHIPTIKIFKIHYSSSSRLPLIHLILSTLVSRKKTELNEANIIIVKNHLTRAAKAPLYRHSRMQMQLQGQE